MTVEEFYLRHEARIDHALREFDITMIVYRALRYPHNGPWDAGGRLDPRWYP